MPIYEAECGEHGLHEVFTRTFGAELPCPECGSAMSRRISAPARVNVSRDWNEQANEARRDPYAQARTQLANVAREEAERSGGTPKKAAEESIQAAAKAIADKTPRKGAVERQFDAQRAATRARKAIQ